MGVMSSMVSLPYHTFSFTGQVQSFKRLTSIWHILSKEIDNCPFWISGREKMTVENISWSIPIKEFCRSRWGWTCNLLITSPMCIQLSHADQSTCSNTFCHIGTYSIIQTLKHIWDFFSYFSTNHAERIRYTSMKTHKICFCGEIRKIFIWLLLLPGPMHTTFTIAPDKALFQPKCIHIFLISSWKHMLWVLIRSALERRF